MLQTNSKVYSVYEWGGSYEDRWERTIGVCSTLELAEELKSKVEDSHKIECSISEEKFAEMYNRLYEYEEETNTISENEIETLYKLFPEYSKEELEKAETIFLNYDDFGGVNIEETDFYN